MNFTMVSQENIDVAFAKHLERVDEDHYLDSWTLKLDNPLTGNTIHECVVTDETDWRKIRRAAYSHAPKEESCKIKYVVYP